MLGSSLVGYVNGVSGPFWFAAGCSPMIVFFAVLGISCKRKIPEAHTLLEIVRIRYGTTAHIVYMFLCLVNNLIAVANSKWRLVQRAAWANFNVLISASWSLRCHNSHDRDAHHCRNFPTSSRRSAVHFCWRDQSHIPNGLHSHLHDSNHPMLFLRKGFHIGRSRVNRQLIRTGTGCGRSTSRIRQRRRLISDHDFEGWYLVWYSPYLRQLWTGHHGYELLHQGILSESSSRGAWICSWWYRLFCDSLGYGYSSQLRCSWSGKQSDFSNIPSGKLARRHTVLFD